MDSGLGIYVHWPFCVSKCPYCDFNSHVAEAIDHGRWRDALLREIDHFAAETPGRRVATLFFGGGTPSLMEPATAAAVIAAVRRHWPVAPDLEITLEANPSSSEAARFADFRAAGVNRLSIGVQSLDESELRFLGRAHDAAQARRAIAMAAGLFDRFSFDLIYGLPGQTEDRWRRALTEAAALAGGHLSLYQLTVEPGTAFHRDGVAEADPDFAADLYDLTQETLEAAGLPAYEVSNHARPGEECRHNLIYWRGGDYLGIGPGAHGRLGDGRGGAVATHQVRQPGHWLAAVEADGHATAGHSTLDAATRRVERVMMGMRLDEGIESALAEDLDADRLAPLLDGGFLEWRDGRLRATAAGRLRLNAVLMAMLA